MRYLIVFAAVVTGLAVSAAASAGGWATVGLDPLPTGVGPGETWTTEMTVLQHGRTPLVGLSPTLTITDESGESRQFVALETGAPGVYEASVVFPEAGQWRIVADSTFGDSKLTYGPVTIESQPDSGGAPGWFPVLPVLGVFAAIVLAAAGAFGVLRLRRLSPAS
ncbi:MAG: FixH family protein [Gaiellaceae bacterium]